MYFAIIKQEFCKNKILKEIVRVYYNGIIKPEVYI